ncbi:MAG: bifunctional (p)ppGpp synthetase/guanosine-3',5'-bis(diphosphate) 3'-pyrophosphohydrolase, partial [Gammaproteobacteria bacterium]|nr:bifunctional (p)ppGpp synthetase/guanosine-3',5'-bis(diphosphate) 3'-pyrophosphohydrolase [Gammaproteobacteria bacterium]
MNTTDQPADNNDPGGLHDPAIVAAKHADAHSASLTARVEQLIDAHIADNPLYEAARKQGQEIAAIVKDFGMDEAMLAGTLLYPLVKCGAISRTQVQKNFGGELNALVREIVKLSDFGFPQNWNPDAGLDGRQIDALRKMLLAIAEDVRLVLVRLADQLHRLRRAKSASADERRQIALETREIFAPLASRLGIWQIKWELEDLAFRFLQPDDYQKIARWLDERRTDREAYIADVIAGIEAQVAAAGITATVQGRPKHIYSIWRKMQLKGLDFQQVFDVRAVRVLLDSVADCYTVLGIVHGNWPYLAGEFDDYIATPKENNYQSLHTAVIGPEHKTVEIQIRTHEMHQHAELGVAAHWSYKEGTAANPSYH